MGRYTNVSIIHSTIGVVKKVNWSDQLTRIRRLIRDPEGLIWSEAMLLRIFNDEQNDLLNQMPVVHNVQALQIPPEFAEAYTFDHEWSMAGPGEVYRFSYFYDAENFAYTAIWEAEHLDGYNADTSAEGTTYTHPWEAWMCDFAEPPPIPLPDNFKSMVALYWDKQEVNPSTKNEIMDDGFSTWRTTTGTPEYYRRDEESNNWIYLYPLPDAEWVVEPVDSGPLTFGGEFITFGDEQLYFNQLAETALESQNQADPDVAAYAVTYTAIDGNLLAIYEQEAVALEADTDESVLPAWMQKYVEYGVAARAFRANTDGQITSLADYWDLRKLATLEAIRIYRMKRLKDRALCLTTQDRSSGGRINRHPRLPSTYPAVN